MVEWEGRYQLPGEGGKGETGSGSFGPGSHDASPPGRPPVVHPRGTGPEYPAPPRPPAVSGPRMDAGPGAGGGEGTGVGNGGSSREGGPPPMPPVPPAGGETGSRKQPDMPAVPARTTPPRPRGETRTGGNMGDVRHPNDSHTPLPDPRAGGNDVGGGFAGGSHSEVGTHDHLDPVAPDAQTSFDSPRVGTPPDFETGSGPGETRRYSGPDFGPHLAWDGTLVPPDTTGSAPNIVAKAARGIADWYVDRTWPLNEDEFAAKVGKRNAVRATATQPRFIATRTKVIVGAPTAIVGEQIAVGAIPAEFAGPGLIVAGVVLAAKKIGGRHHIKAGAIAGGSGVAIEGMALSGEPRIAGAAVAALAGATALKGVYEGVTRAVRWQRSEGVVSRELRRQSKLRSAVTTHEIKLRTSELKAEAAPVDSVKERYHEMRAGMHTRALQRRRAG